MKLNQVVLAALLGMMALAGACSTGGNVPPAKNVAIEAAYGSSLEGVTLEQGRNSVILTVAELATDGKLLRLRLPESSVPSNEMWAADEGTLHLVAPVEEGAEIGIVPTADYRGQAVRLELMLESGNRSTSVAPKGTANAVKDLTVTNAAVGQVELSWTQLNVGDYNFDGEVNISDLTPMAPRLKQTVDRSQPGADQQTAYWIDGDANGEINLADITPIGANYRAQVFGYNIRQNNSLFGPVPSISKAAAQHRLGLPNRYQVQLAGQTSDNWSVCPVDKDGNEGPASDSGSHPGPVDFTANLNVVGLDLRDLETGLVGGFGPGKFSTRVIDPIDVVDRSPLGNVVMDGTQSVASQLTRGRVYIVDFRYAPTISLETGTPKGGSSLKGTSAVPEDEIVTTSVIFKLPAGDDPAEIDLEIEAIENPEGEGYILDLTANLTIPGDDPLTPGIQTSYTQQQNTRVYYADSLVSRDTNGNGFEDNVKVCDPDRDGVSDGLRELFRTFDDDDDGHDDGEEIEVEGFLASLDLCDATVTMQDAGFVVEIGPYVDLGGKTFYFSEATEFLERTDQFEDGIIVDPAGFMPGEAIKVDMYPIEDAAGNTVGYWVEKVVRDLRT